MKPREFIAAVSGAVSWPVLARGQTYPTRPGSRIQCIPSERNPEFFALLAAGDNFADKYTLDVCTADAYKWLGQL